MSINNLLKQSCTVATQGAVNKVGKYAFSAPVTYACRFQKTSRIIHTVQNEKTPIDGIVFLPASAVISMGDKVTFGTDIYRIMRIEPMVDGKGTTRHFEVLVQDWST